MTETETGVRLTMKMLRTPWMGGNEELSVDAVDDCVCNLLTTNNKNG